MQRLGGEHRGPVVADPFEHGGQPELDRLRHALGLQPGDDVAGCVPAHPAPDFRAGHLEAMRAQVLVAVPGGGTMTSRCRSDSTGASYS